MEYLFKQHKSVALIGFGIMQLLLGLTLTILALTVMTATGDVPAFAFTAFTCGLLFLVMGMFSTYAGFNVWQRQEMVVLSFTLGILGVMLAVANIVINIENLTWYRSGDNCFMDCVEHQNDFKTSIFCYRVCGQVLFKWVFIILSALATLTASVLCSLYFYKSKNKYKSFQNELRAQATYNEANFTRGSPVLF